jgi:hypothetical protein
LLPKEIIRKNILISALNWGNGHVSRCIPLIFQLLEQENKVIFAGNESQVEIIRCYIPQIKTIQHEGYPFKFGTKGNFSWDLFKAFVSLYKRFTKEKKETAKIVEQFNIDVIISDHRYGFYTNGCINIFITHQINLPVRWYEKPIQIFHKKMLKKFDLIWIPDTKNAKYSGRLSLNKKGLNTHYIGTLSRFSIYKEIFEKDLDKVVIVSGPLNLAQLYLKNELTKIALDSKESVVVLPKALNYLISKDLPIICINNWNDADRYILRAKKIIARSGYSTIMDVSQLNCDAELSATPGQREQVYLLRLWNKNLCQNTIM